MEKNRQYQATNELSRHSLYVPGRAEDYFKQVYPEYEKYKSNVGISAVMNESK